MYSLQLLKAPKKCASPGCQTVVTSHLAGHHFVDPMCHSCFEQAAPDVAVALGLRPTSIQLLTSRLDVECANCGDDLSGRRIAGYHLGDPLCNGCFQQYALDLAVLLFLHDAVLKAAAHGKGAQGLLRIAIAYAKCLERLDARHPRKPVKPKKPSS